MDKEHSRLLSDIDAAIRGGDCVVALDGTGALKSLHDGARARGEVLASFPRAIDDFCEYAGGRKFLHVLMHRLAQEAPYHYPGANGDGIYDYYEIAYSKVAIFPVPGMETERVVLVTPLYGGQEYLAVSFPRAELLATYSQYAELNLLAVEQALQGKPLPGQPLRLLLDKRAAIVKSQAVLGRVLGVAVQAGLVDRWHQQNRASLKAERQQLATQSEHDDAHLQILRKIARKSRREDRKAPDCKNNGAGFNDAALRKKAGEYALATLRKNIMRLPFCN